MNGPASITLAGEAAALESVLNRLAGRKVFHRLLDVNYAFHSHQVEPFQAELTQALSDLTCRPPEITTFSTVTGRAFREGDFGSTYWARNIRRPVRFWSALDTLIQAGHRTFVEIGPHPVLAAAISQCLAHRAAQGQVLASIRRDADEQATMLGALCRLFALGHAVDWKGLYPKGECLNLPLYAWHKRRFWTTADPKRAAIARKSPQDDPSTAYGTLIRLRSPLIRDVVFECCLDVEAQPLLGEHRVFGGIVLPASAYVEIVLAAAGEAFGEDFRVLSDVSIQSSLVLQPDAKKTVQVILKRCVTAAVSFEVSVLAHDGGPQSDEWLRLSTGTVVKEITDLAAPRPLPDGLRDGVPTGRGEAVAGERFYRDLEQRGIVLGPQSRCIEAYWPNGDDVVVRLRLPQTVPATITGERIHPILIDACLQAAAIIAGGHPRDGLYVVVGLDRFRQCGPAASTLVCHVRPRPQPAVDGGNYCADVTLCDMRGAAVAEVLGVCLKRVEAGAMLRNADSRVEAEILEVTWLERALPESFSGGAAVQGDWLVFADSSGVSDALALQLSKLGGRCRLIEAGHSYATADGRLTIDPTRADHYEWLARELMASNGPKSRAIVYLWGLENAATGHTESPPQGAFWASANLLHLIKALTGGLEGECPPLWIATRGAQALDSTETPRIEQAPLWGLGRVIAAEHPEMWGGLVDLDPGAPPQAAAADLLAQIGLADEERQVLLRRNRRFVPALVPVNKAPAPSPAWDSRAAYLIVGGLGGVGLQTAVWMAEQGVRRLILMARTPLPDRSEWDCIGSGHAHFDRIAAIRGMEAVGAEVKTVAADVADETQMRSLLEALGHEGWMPIRGVIHTAAVVHDALLSRIDADALREVFRPKIDGGWLLHRLFEDQPLDFMVYFSSIGALVGQTGQGSYAAANAFLDALAHYRNAKGRPAQSINWGAWIDSGLAVTQGGMRAIQNFSRQGIQGISARKAAEAFGRLLSAGMTQTVITGIDWRRLREQLPSEADLTLTSLAQLSAAASSVQASAAEVFDPVGGLRQALGAAKSGFQRRDLFEGEIARMLAAVLKMESAEIDPEKPFGSLGLDSLTALEFKNRCESISGLTLSATMAWNHPTVRALAAHLAGKMGIALDEAPVGDDTAAALQPERQVEKPGDTRVLESVGNLSDEEALRQLLGKAGS